MSWEPPPRLSLPTGLSDETLAQLLECFYELARSLENHYTAELRRYYAGEDPPQQCLWPEEEPPF